MILILLSSGVFAITLNGSVLWTLCDPMDGSLPGSSVLGISQSRVLGVVAISSSRGSPRPRDWAHVSCIGRQILYFWATREAHVCLSALQIKSKGSASVSLRSNLIGRQYDWQLSWSNLLQQEKGPCGEACCPAQGYKWDVSWWGKLSRVLLWEHAMC